MKLSKIIEVKNLHSVTIHVLNSTTVVCEKFIIGRKNPVKKVYKNLDVDINIPETSIGTVKHLGIKKYYYLQTEKYYINLYYSQS